MIYFLCIIVYVQNVHRSFFLHIHPKFTDEGILGNPDLKFYFLWLVHSVGHAACDDSGGITTGHCWVDIKVVDVPVILSKYRRYISQFKKMAWFDLAGWHPADQRSDDSEKQSAGGRHHWNLIGLTVETPHYGYFSSSDFTFAHFFYSLTLTFTKSSNLMIHITETSFLSPKRELRPRNVTMLTDLYTFTH